MQKTYDLIVVGGGPGGYVAAIRAAQLGARVALIEQQHLGGICLNWGCIPTKALLRSAEILHLCQQAHLFGINVSDPKPDFSQIIERSRKISKQLNQGVSFLLNKNKVTVFEEHASILKSSPDAVSIQLTHSKKTIQTKKLILATGAKPRQLTDFPYDHKYVWNYKDALSTEKIPESMIVIGSGAIGLEFASIYNSLGTHVTILDASPLLLPMEDRSVATFVTEAFRTRKISMLPSVSLRKLSVVNKKVVLDFSIPDKKSSQLTAEVALFAVGVVPNVENIGLDNCQAKLHQGFIQTDAFGQTSDPNIYAIGDVRGTPCLAHKAEHEGVVAAEKLFAKSPPHPINYQHIPACTYSLPQIASIGLNEQQAKQQNIPVSIGVFQANANGKALALGENNGFVKLIFHKHNGSLLGAHMAGHETTELIHSISLAMHSELVEEDLWHTIFPHPTISEMIHEASLDAFSRPIHK